MKMVAMDTVSASMSVALLLDGRALYEVVQRQKAQHASTLMPAMDAAFRTLGWTPGELDAIAVSAGPGSFTGVRIGICAAKGMAMALDLPIVEVDALDALAQNALGWAPYVCAMQDARNQQVYAALYAYEQGAQRLKKERADRALRVDALLETLPAQATAFVGEGALAYAEEIRKKRPDALILPQSAACIRAGSVGELAMQRLAAGESSDALCAAPIYLRVSQAQREYEAKRLAKERREPGDG